MKLSDLLSEDAKTDYLIRTVGHKLEDAAHNDISARAYHGLEQLLNKIREIDPTNGKYLQFLVNKYIQKEFRIEDAERVKSALVQFEKKRQTLPNKDINQFKSLHDLYDAVETAAEPAPVSKKQEAKQKKAKGSETLVNTPNLKIVRLLDDEAACYYAAGTKWCTSNAETFKSYANQGDIYVIMARNTSGTGITNKKTGEKVPVRKYQLHYQSGQIMDEQDKAIGKKDIALLSSNPEWYEFIDHLVKTHYHEI